MIEKNITTLIIIAVVATLLIATYRKKQVSSAKTAEIKTNRPGEKLFLCNAVEDIGDNLIQFYGEAVGTAIRPGMKIIEPSGMEYIVKEVYANQERGKEHLPSPEMPEGLADCALVIEKTNINYQNLKEHLKKDGVLALQIK